MLTFLDFASSYKFIKIIRSVLVSVMFLVEVRSLASLSLSLSPSIYIYTLMLPNKISWRTIEHRTTKNFPEAWQIETTTSKRNELL